MVNQTVYFMAPIHDEADQEANAKVIKQLRANGLKVYAPQEHGLWEEALAENDYDENRTRRYFYDLDVDAMNMCNIGIAYQYRPKGPSEGQLWEMGYMVGQGKNVYLINENDHGFNLMPQFGSLNFPDVNQLIAYLEEECPR